MVSHIYYKNYLLGTNCEVNIDECALYPCLNEATCVDGINNFTCNCRPGFTGRSCETNIDECQVTLQKLGRLFKHDLKFYVFICVQLLTPYSQLCYS